MKKIGIVLVLLTALGKADIYAQKQQGVMISAKAAESFRTQFNGASSIRWKESSETGGYLADFVYNGKATRAFYDADGNLAGTARLLTEEQLPILVTKTLTSSYAQYEIREITEVTRPEETKYLVTLYSDRQTIYLRMYADGSAQVVRKQKNKKINFHRN